MAGGLLYLKLNHDLGISTPPSFKQRYKDIYQEVLDKFNEDLKTPFTQSSQM